MKAYLARGRLYVAWRCLNFDLGRAGDEVVGEPVSPKRGTVGGQAYLAGE